MQYYIAVNGQTTGPFSIEELKARPLQPHELVWYQGAQGWAAAETVAELQVLFVPAAQAQASQTRHDNTELGDDYSAGGGATQFVEETAGGASQDASTELSGGGATQFADNATQLAGGATQLAGNDGMGGYNQQPNVDPYAAQKYQPAGQYDDNGDSMPAPPSAHLLLAFIGAIMFFPTGIAAIVKSSLVGKRYNEYRFEDARWLSKSSKSWAIASIIIGVLINGGLFCLTAFC